MAYLVNQTRVSSLTIGGVTYTNNLLSFTVTDTSAYKNGIIQTTGTLVLGENPNGVDLGDYDRTIFKRGTVIILDVEDPETSAVTRHPRGYMYVISTGYKAETGTLELNIGCSLTLAALTEEVDEILPLVPVPLEPERQDFGNCSASFVAAGQCLYQDNEGVLQVVTFFDGDVNDSVAPGEWTSVLGVTALSASPMLGGNAIPDTLLLSYQVPAGAIGTSDLDKIDETITDSYYFLNYPTTSYVRVSTGLSNVTGISTTYNTGGTTSGCGNTPSEPAGNPDLITCNEGYQVSQEPVILPCTSQEISRTYYSGPSSQVERTRSEKYGPAVELNGQYFSDLFAYCRYTWATACNPNGSCAYEGMDQILQSYTETYNYYGPSGELVQTIQDSYSNILSAAQQFDWRAGVVDGIPQEFRRINYISGTTTSQIRVGSGTSLHYRSKATSYQQTVDNDGFYYVDGQTVYLSRRDSNGTSTTSALPSVTGVGVNSIPICPWQYNSATGFYELACNYPDMYVSVSSDGYWPKKVRLNTWNYGFSAISGLFTAQIRLIDKEELPEGSTLSLYQGFSYITATAQAGAFYRDQRTVTDYVYSSDGNIQTTTTYNSIASNNIGIYRSSLDALNGVITVQRRISRTITANPIAPDRVSSSSSSIIEQSSEYPIFLSTYQESVGESGPYVLKEAMPVPLLFVDEDTLASTVQAYSNYLIRFIKGDTLGYTIGESLRPEIIENWRPGMPFRYCDQEKDRILALRMDSCSWGVTPTASAVVTNGIWIGNSDGTLVPLSNLSGNSTPSLDEDPPTPPVGPSAPPSINNEVYTSSGPISFVFTVHIGTKVLFPFDEAQSIASVNEPIETDIYQTFVCFMSGLVVAPGNLLGTTSTGSVPIGAGGSLVTAGATIIIPELFPDTSGPAPIGVSVSIPNTFIDIAIFNPTVSLGGSASPPPGAIEVTALYPELTGAGAVVKKIDPGVIDLIGQDPTVSLGTVASPAPAIIDIVAWPPPTVGGWTDPYWASVSMLIPFDASFDDIATARGSTVVTGSVSRVTTEKKFGTHSAYFPGATATYLTFPDPSSTLVPGLLDFTAEFWWYPMARSASLMPTWGSAVSWGNTGSVHIGYANANTATQIFLYVYISGNQYNNNVATYYLNLNTWHHIAIARQNGIFRVFVNGLLYLNVTNLTGANITSPFNTIGRSDATNFTPYYFVDELRFTKGIARYTAAFTPPTLPFPNPYPR